MRQRDMWNRVRRSIALAACWLLAATQVQAQSWNLYGNGPTFFVPITLVPNGGAPPLQTVSLTLNGQQSAFTLDTGSLGLVSDKDHYSPGSDPMIAAYATIKYTSVSQANPIGSLYLTNVQINGTNGQSVTARVPILRGTNGVGITQLGIGYGRNGLMIGPDASSVTAADASYNLNPFFALVSSPNVNVAAMQPGYIIGTNGFPSLGLGSGVLLGLNNTNTAGFSFVQLASAGGLPSYCSTAGMGCPLNWSAQNGTITIANGGRTYQLGAMSVLPDSGISYMIINAPNAGLPVTSSCRTGLCLPNGATVSVYLPGQPNVAAYTFTVNNSSTTGLVPYEVQVNQSNVDGSSSNLGGAFFQNLLYLYDPINGFVGYQFAGTSGTTATVIPMLALQGSMVLPNGFLSTFPTFLMGGLTLTQNGSGTWNGPIFGPGGLALASGNVTLGGTNSYAGGTVVNGGLLTIANTGSIIGDVTVNNGGSMTNNGTIGGNGLLTVNTGGSFTNNGTVNTPLQWQLNQGSFTNTGTFNASLANTGTAINTGTITGSVINGNTGTFTNNGTIGGSVANMGLWNGSGTIGGNLVNAGIVAPGNNGIGAMTVSGNFANATGTYQVEVNGTQSDQINVGGQASLQGGTVYVYVQPGTNFGPSTTYRIVGTAGGLSGTFGAVNELYPFLLSSLSYDAYNAWLTLQIGGFAAAAVNNNQYAVGTVLDASAAGASGDYAQVLSAIATNTLSDQAAQSVLQQLSGNNYAGFSTAMVQGAQLFMNNFANQSGGGGSPLSNRVALAEACDVACDTVSPPKWGAWGGALGGLGTIGASQPVGGVTYNAGGFAAGLDRRVTDNFRMGVTAGYTTGTQWVSGFNGVGRSDTWQAGLYGGYAQGPVYADAVAGYAYSYNQMWRYLTVPGLQPRTALGQTGANQWYGQLETGYRFDIGTAANAFVTPFARLQAYTGTQNAFTESGAQSLNLSIAQQTTNSLRSVIGAQIGGAMDLGWREKLAVQLRLGWSHEFADVGRPVTATLAGAPAMPFTTWGVSPQRDGAVIGISANTAIAEATSLYVRYEGDIAGQDNMHAITAGVRMTW